MKRLVQQWSVLVLVSLLSACNGGTPVNSGSGSAPNMAGNWQYSAESTPFGYIVTGSGTLQQNGNSITGNLSLSGTPCAIAATLNGSVSGTTLSFQLQEENQAVNFKGTVTTDGSSASGTYSAPAGGCTNGDYGSWSATHVTSLNGMFVGSFHQHESASVPSHATLNITQDENGVLRGQAFLTNSACFASVDLVGRIIGQTFSMTAINSIPEQSIEFDGKVDPQAKLLNLSYVVNGGHCDGESGSGTLARR